jgi:hypothetical protein
MSFSDYFIVVDPKASKFIDIYFKTVNISTDAGLIFPTEVYQSEILFDYYREQILVQVVDDIIVDFYIGSSRNYMTYTRIYQKFQDFAATVGGLLKVMTLLAYFITCKFTRYSMYEKMFNCLYNFDFEGKESNLITIPKTKNSHSGFGDSKIINQNLDQSVEKKFNIQNRTPNITTLNIENNFLNYEDFKKTINNSSLNLNLKSRFDLEIQKNKKRFNMKIHLTPTDVVKMYCCNCFVAKQKKKLNLFQQAFAELHKYLDYLQIVQTLQQFHGLRNVIFSKSQNNLFSLHSKPLIREKELDEKAKKKSQTSINSRDENFSIFDDYVKAKEKQDENKTYKRLLRNMDENSKNIFNNLELKIKSII